MKIHYPISPMAKMCFPLVYSNWSDSPIPPKEHQKCLPDFTENAMRSASYL